ncbi:MAG: Uma2 family endonuclease [Pirellulales bacterium]
MFRPLVRWNVVKKTMSTVAPINVSNLRQEHVYLPGISYATYAALIDEVGDRRNLRFTYDHGALEIMSPSQDHERAKKLFGRMIEALTEELNISLMSCGSTTFRDELRDCGLEPDECYYIQHETAVRGRKIKLGEDPPPDLVVEVDVTTTVIDRFSIYAALGFPEIWQYVDGDLVVHLLKPDGKYAAAVRSVALPMVPIERLVVHLERCSAMDETSWIREFRQWIRSGMN